MKLRKVKNFNYVKAIYITADLTPMEQQKNKLLREQLILNKRIRKVIFLS